MCGAVGDGLVDVDVTVANLEVEATSGIATHPGLKVDGGPMTAEVGQGYQVPFFAPLALG